MEEYREEYRMLGLRIAFYRKKAGLTQEQFSNQVGCSPGFLSRIEANNGKKVAGISLPMLFRMAKVLNVSVCALLEDRM
nr:helix-turn-helix transcriptional regulator [uncultured Oscillibacter sp.]